MKNWQKSRNYRRIKDKNGNVIANIITADAVDVEVTEEVFLAYSQADRRERYITEELEPGKVLSLDKLLEDNVLLSELGVDQEPSAEEIALDRADIRENAFQKAQLATVVSKLDEKEIQLIQALFFEGVSTREYACRTGVTQRAIIKRRDRILRDIKKIFENLSN